MNSDEKKKGILRRSFMKTVGAGTAVAALTLPLAIATSTTTLNPVAAHAQGQAANPALTDYKAFLKEARLGVLTTVEGNQPRTRVFLYLWSDGDKAYFSTSVKKDVYKQMQNNNRVSFCAWDQKNNVVLSLDGPVTFVTDKAIKQKAFDTFPNIRVNFKDMDNPDWALFCIDPEQIYTFSFSGGKQYIKR